MKSAIDFKPDRSCAILLVGEPKTGKTNICFAFPNPYFLDFDLNLASGIRRNQGANFKYDQPSVNDDGSPRPPEARWDAAVKYLKIALTDPSIDTVIIDGLTVLAETLCAHIVHAGVKAGTCKTGKMEIQHYGDLARILRDLTMMLRASGKLVVVTSHQVADKDENTGALRYVLSIPGQCKDTLGGLFTDVWATTAKPAGIDKTKYEIRTKPTGYHVSLGTSFDLPPGIDVTDKSPTQVWAILGPKLKG